MMMVSMVNDENRKALANLRTFNDWADGLHASMTSTFTMQILLN